MPRPADSFAKMPEIFLVSCRVSYRIEKWQTWHVTCMKIFLHDPRFPIVLACLRKLSVRR